MKVFTKLFVSCIALIGASFALNAFAAPPVQGYSFTVYQNPAPSLTKARGGDVLIHFSHTTQFGQTVTVSKEDPLQFTANVKQGDIRSFNNDLYTLEDLTSAKAGNDNGHCVRTRNTSIPADACETNVQGDWECAWTNDLSKGVTVGSSTKTGSLTVTGTLNDNCVSTLLIVGGTGNFEKAQGHVTVSPITDVTGAKFRKYEVTITNLKA